MQLNEASDRFFVHCRSALSLSAHTLLAYQSDLRDFLRDRCAMQDLLEINKDSVRAYLRHMREGRRLKETTIKRRLATLKALVKWLVEEGLVPEHPLASLNERIRLPKRLPRALDRSDRDLLRKAATVRSEHGRDFDSLRRATEVHLLLETGVRVGELVSIDVSDVSMSDGCIIIHGKGNRQRLAYVSQRSLQKRLTKYLDTRRTVHSECDRLFVSASGQPLSTSSVRRDLRCVAAAAGISRRVTPHMLRHTCATDWLERGLDIRYVQRLLGHHSISTTEVYTHVSDQSLREALRRVAGGR